MAHNSDELITLKVRPISLKRILIHRDKRYGWMQSVLIWLEE